MAYSFLARRVAAVDDAAAVASCIVGDEEWRVASNTAAAAAAAAVADAVLQLQHDMPQPCIIYIALPVDDDCILWELTGRQLTPCCYLHTGYVVVVYRLQ